MAGEYENTFEHSRNTTDLNPDAACIDRLIKGKRFVLVADYPVYCKHTDGFLGTQTTYVGNRDTREEAQYDADRLNAMNDPGGDTIYRVLPRNPIAQIIPIRAEENDVPF